MASAERLPVGAKRIMTVLALIVLVALGYEAQTRRDIETGIRPETENSVGYYYTVTKVIDGDTMHVDLDGHDEKVRLIGINTPETVDPRKSVECFGKEASSHMKDLAEGKIVRLEYDDSQGIRDAYDRLLAYVYLEDGEMLNRKMVAEGYAYEYTYLKPYKYQEEFRQLQNLARVSSRGLWAANTCNGETKMP